MYTVKLTSVIEKFKLRNYTPDINIEDVLISQTDVNRPALQLTGFYDYFDSDRIQIIGNVEYSYLRQQGRGKYLELMSTLFDYKIPCIVYCRNLEVEPELIKIATEKGVPILRTDMTTSGFTSELIRWLKVELAPRISIHGVLVDVYGEGVLIMGESGIGKSEAALELIKRGHRLVADDVVVIKKVSDDTLIGESSDITRQYTIQGIL